MFERDLDNECTNDAVVTIRTPNQDEGERPENFRSQITRNGKTSLEIEIPRRGISGADIFSMFCFMSLPLGFLLIGILIAPYFISSNGVNGLWSLFFVGVPLLFIYCVLTFARIEYFTHTTIRITSNTYCLTTRNITWRSFFQITCIPSHFNDLENGEAEETDPKKKSYPRSVSLEAKIEAHHNEDLVTNYIKLDSVSFAWGFDDGELEWLTEEINCFLRETH